MDADTKYEDARDERLERRKDCIHKKENNQCEFYNERCYFVTVCLKYKTKLKGVRHDEI